MAVVVMGDTIQAMCAAHQVPGPSGAPMPSPAPMPFGAPLTTGLSTKVHAGGKPVALLGSAGFNAPPHVGLHGSDPFLAPTQQKGSITAGSSKVQAEDKALAYSGCATQTCFAPGTVSGSASTVTVAP